MKKKTVAQLMEEYGLTESQAHYVLDGSRRDLNKPYTPKPRRDKWYSEMKELGITVIPNSDSEYGWDVFRDGKKKTIFVAKGTQYKNGSCKYYPAVAITHNYKQSLWSLSSLIWLGYLGKNIPAGYVVDHIDNDSFNNDVSNLQLLTIRQNLEKNPSKKRQYKNDLEIQAKKHNVTYKEFKKLFEKALYDNV